MRLALTGLALAAALTATPAFGAEWTFKDPRGDDKGPGSYEYPSDAVYKPGSFDLQKVEIEADGDTVRFVVHFARKLEDPWNSKEWGGNGFSLQFVQIYLDKDGKAGSGSVDALPGLNARFPAAQAWDRVVLLSPQGRARLQSEIDAKAGDRKAAIVIPKSVRARGRRLVAEVATKDLGSAPAAGWSVQVVVQSNEGYPRSQDLLTRPVNEIPGAHRFGGGNDWDCDPHVIDLLAGAGAGADGEAKAQYEALAAHSCEGVPDKKGTLAVLPMLPLK